MEALRQRGKEELIMEETKTCKDCGRELPLADFSLNRWGTRNDTCRECKAEKFRGTRFQNRQVGGGKLPPFSDPDFDGKTNREVMDMMSRAKRWLESRGYEITLSGIYKETIIKPIKF